MHSILHRLRSALSGRAPTRTAPSRRHAFHRPTCRPRLETLEDRTAPASLSYSTYLPGTVWATAVDSAGNVYATGAGWGSGCFVAKMNATGTALDWVTNLSNAAGKSIAVDASGDVYVGGNAASGFPTTPNALDPTMPSTSSPGFLAVLNPTGSSLLYSTYLPGTQFVGNGAGYSPGADIAIDHSGGATGSLDHVYLTGGAVAGFPTTAGAFQANFGGNRNAFFAVIDPNLSGSASLLYGTYLGGTLNAASVNSGNGGWDSGSGIAVDGSGNAYVVGRTASTNFPTTLGAFQTTYGGGLEDVFVAKFNPSLSGSSSLVYSTYLGGSGGDGYYTDYPGVINLLEPGPGIAVDSAGNAYVAGTTTSTNFPTTPGAFVTTYQNQVPSSVPQGDAFVTKLNPTGTGLVYSTYLGGSNNDGATSIAVDSSGNAYVTGWTRSTNFPTMNPIQAQKASGVDSAGSPNSDVFVTTLNSTGTGLLFSTYFGGPGGTLSKKGAFTGSNGDEYGYSIALDSAGNAYVAGSTSVQGESVSTSFPTTAGAYDTTPGGGLVFKIDPPAGGGTAAPTGSTGGGPAATAAADKLFAGYAGDNATLAALLLADQADGQGPTGHLHHRT